MLSWESRLSMDYCFSWPSASMNRVIVNSLSKDRMLEEKKEDVL